MGSKLKQILHYLDEHYTETISLDFLAEEFYISKYYLAREFKKEYGTTIIRYVLAKKNHPCQRASALQQFLD